jgi:hypothetical protein
MRRGRPDQHDSLRIAVASSAVIAAIGLLIGPLITTIINFCPCRSIDERSRNCRGFDTDRLLLLRLIVVVGVIDDDDLAIARRPEDVTVEVTEKLFGEFLIARSVNEALPCSNTVSSGGAMKPPTGTLVEAEIRTAPAVESLHRQAEDFPLQKESAHA